MGGYLFSEGPDHLENLRKRVFWSWLGIEKIRSQNIEFWQSYDRFYYDFSRKEPFTEEDLTKIEDKMKEIVDRDEQTKKEIWQREEAINWLKKKENTIKLK